MTANRDSDSLLDMLEAASLVGECIKGKTVRQLQSDKICSSAVKYQLMIIGEAANRISPEFRTAHPAIPWLQMIGMRNILVHAYHKVSLARVWKVATISVPELVTLIKLYISPNSSPSETWYSTHR